MTTTRSASCPPSTIALDRVPAAGPASRRSPAWLRPTTACAPTPASSSRSTSRGCPSLHPPRQLGPARGLRRRRRATAPTVGYGRVEWHDLVDGDRIYDHTVLVEPSALGARGRPGPRSAGASAAAARSPSGNPTDRRTWLAQSAFDGDTELEGALRDAGYVAVRWDAEMLRPDLEHIPDVPLAEGYELRVPHRGGAAGRVRDDRRGVRRALGPVRGGRAAPRRVDREPGASAWTRWSSPGRATSRPRWSTASSRPGPTGPFTACSPASAPTPAHRRLGLARACIVESLRRLRDAGATSAYLGVDTDNQNRAYALYESCGFRIATSSASYRKPFSPGGHLMRSTFDGGPARRPACPTRRPSRASRSATASPTTGPR